MTSLWLETDDIVPKIYLTFLERFRIKKFEMQMTFQGLRGRRCQNSRFNLIRISFSLLPCVWNNVSNCMISIMMLRFNINKKWKVAVVVSKRCFWSIPLAKENLIKENFLIMSLFWRDFKEFESNFPLLRVIFNPNPNPNPNPDIFQFWLSRKPCWYYCIHLKITTYS